MTKPAMIASSPTAPGRKRPRSARDQGTVEHRRKSPRLAAAKSRQQHGLNLRQSSPILHTGLEPQEHQAPNQPGNTRAGQSRPSQAPVVKQYHRRQEEDKPPTTSPVGRGGRKRIKRQRDTDNEDKSICNTRRPRHRLVENTRGNVTPDKEAFIQDWLEDSSWARPVSTEDGLGSPGGSLNMPRKPAPVLPSPDHSFERTTSTSRKSATSATSVYDTNYRQSLQYRNIFIEREDPPVELMQRAQMITTRPRASPEMDDAAVQKLKDKSREIRDEAENVIIKQLSSHLIPAMDEVPDRRLKMNSDQRWVDAVPIPLHPDVLMTPLPLSQPKPDLTFGFSEAAFTRKQLTTIDLLVDDEFGRSYAIPDQRLRFPFLQVEFKSQAKSGTHYIATNQAASAGAIASNGYLNLIQRSHGREKFDYNEPSYFSISMDHQLVCINIHYLKASTDGGQHSFHVEGLSQHLLKDVAGIRAVVRAIKNILDYGTDTRLQTLCGALDAYREAVIRERNNENAPGQRQASLPDVQAGEEIVLKETTTKSKASPRMGPRSRPAPARTSRHAQNPMEVPARVTRLSAKRSSKVMFAD